MFCTTLVLEKCLGFTKPSWWSYSCLAGDTFPKPKSCKTLFLTTKAFSLPLVFASLLKSLTTWPQLVCIVKSSCFSIYRSYILVLKKFILILQMLSKINQVLIKRVLQICRRYWIGNVLVCIPRKGLRNTEISVF